MYKRQFSILLVDSSFPINTRNERIIDSIKYAFQDFNIRYACWNRDDYPVSDVEKYNFIYYKKSGYGNRFNKLFRLLGYYMYLKRVYQNEKIDVVIASHWDCLFLCSLLKQKDQILIYENLDIPTFSVKSVLWILQQIERLSLRRADAIVFASRFFKPLYKFFLKTKLVVENKLPSANCRTIIRRSLEEPELIVTFLGNIRYASILKNLIEALGGMDGVVCRIWGNGPDFRAISQIASTYNNVEMLDRYQYNQVPNIYETTDVIWAVYPSSNYNVNYAISNKYHESIYYGVPAIYAAGTKLADMVEADQTGFTVDPYSVDNIKKLIMDLRDNKYELLGKIHQSLDAKSEKEKVDWNTEMIPFLSYINKCYIDKINNLI